MDYNSLILYVVVLLFGLMGLFSLILCYQIRRFIKLRIQLERVMNTDEYLELVINAGCLDDRFD
jgi:hypothetical protein